MLTTDIKNTISMAAPLDSACFKTGEHASRKLASVSCEQRISNLIMQVGRSRTEFYFGQALRCGRTFNPAERLEGHHPLFLFGQGGIEAHCRYQGESVAFPSRCRSRSSGRASEGNDNAESLNSPPAFMQRSERFLFDVLTTYRLKADPGQQKGFLQLQGR